MQTMVIWRSEGRESKRRWGECRITLLLLLLITFPSGLFADHVLRFDQDPKDTEGDFLEVLEEEQFMMSGPLPRYLAHGGKAFQAPRNSRNSSSNMADSRQTVPASSDPGGSHMAEASSSRHEETSSFPPGQKSDHGSLASEGSVGETTVRRAAMEVGLREEYEDDFLTFSEDAVEGEERRRGEERQLAMRIKRDANTFSSGEDTVKGMLNTSIPYNSSYGEKGSQPYNSLETMMEELITAFLTSNNVTGTVTIDGFSDNGGSTGVDFTVTMNQEEEVDRVGVADALLSLTGHAFLFDGQNYTVTEEPQLESGVVKVYKVVSCILCEQYGYKECVQNASDTTVWICQSTSAHYFPHGNNQGDRCLRETQSPFKIKIPEGLPIDGELVPKLFISVRGLISFNRRYGSPSPRRLPRRNANLMCGYWADTQLRLDDSRAKWCYQVYERQATNTSAEEAMLAKGGQKVMTYTNTSAYQPVYMLVVTFEDLPPDQSQVSTTERANFQMAVISDGFTTYGMFVYAQGGMQWDSDLQHRVTIGYFNHNFDLDTSRPDTTVGNTGYPGVWFFQLSSEVNNPVRKCLNWYLDELPHVNEYTQAMNSLPACPCVRNVTEFSNNLVEEPVQDGVACYLTVSSNHAKRCCYLDDAGSFLQSPPSAGSFLLHHLNVNASGYTLKDQLPKGYCCTDSDQCTKYYEVRPISTCQTVPVRRSLGTGDPHVTTLDGKTFSFNAVGEFTLTKFQQPSFELQARTCEARGSDGKAVKASVFCAFAAKGGQGTFQVELTIDRASLNLFLDRRDISLPFKQKENYNETENDVYVRRKLANTVQVYFRSEGIGFTVTVENRQLTFQMDLWFENTGPPPTGLLGNMNGIQDDDYIFPNGTALPANTSERDLLTYGKAWAVTDNSLFVYPGDWDTSHYTNDSFEPIFLSEISDDEQTQAEAVCGGGDNLGCIYDYFATKDEALAKGTKSGKEDLVSSLRLAENRAPTVKLPEGVTRLKVTVGKPTTFNFNATDEDDDTLPTYRVLQEPTNFTFNQASQTAEWTPESSAVPSLEMAVVDSQGASSPSLRVSIVQCSGCNNHGTCNFDQLRLTGDDYFQLAECDCDPYHIGPDCEEEYNGCAEDPCPSLTNCTDMTNEEHIDAGPDSGGFRCSDCPDGYLAINNTAGDPVDCKDVDECVRTEPCQQTCSNTIGSYECSCGRGYRQDPADKNKCLDIDECQENTHDCQQVCVNTAGNWNCSCFSGYSQNVASDNTCVKDEVDPCAAIVPPCEYACKNESGATVCLCPSGYKVNVTDQRSCTDINECDLNQCSQRCTDTEGSYVCSCHAGYELDADKVTCNACPTYKYGENCTQTCDCRGRGTCDSVKGCVCDDGWSGTTCSNDIDECKTVANACPADQICRNTLGSFSCDCPTGFQKDSASQCQDFDECALPSDNDCSQVCTNSQGSYHCSCHAGYDYVSENNTCVDIDECAESIDNCQYSCENFPGSANCICGLGFILNDDRRTCVEMENPCDALADGKDCEYACSIFDGAAQCYCKNGYALHADGLRCVDVDECTKGTHRCTQECDNTPGNYQCSCSLGFQLENDQRKCVECDGNHWGVRCSNTCDCNPLGVDHCNKKSGCVCKAGWAGVKCDLDVDECLRDDPAPCATIVNSECANTAGSFRCPCLSGFRLSASGNACEDINECDPPARPCDQTCSNNVGSFLCSCAEGFRTEGRSCIDIDECKGFPCDQVCRNTFGGYSCECETGFLLNTTTRNTCYVQTECSGTNSCQHGCVHIPSQGDECYCNAGFKLNATNNATCDDIDECANSPCVNGNCTNSPPGSFTCACNAGFKLLPDKIICQACPEGKWGDNCASDCTCSLAQTVSCDPVSGNCSCLAGWKGENCSTDVDECNDTSICVNVTNSQCANTDGSYRCKCSDGFFTSVGQCLPCDVDKYGPECRKKCSCERTNTANCDDVSGVCTCKPQWTGVNCTEDVDECTPSTDPCQTANHEQCHNTLGAYTCNCVAGYARPSPGDNCTDIDECESPTSCNSTTERCINSDGSYTCVCAMGYSNDTGTCQDINECETTCNGTKESCVNTGGSYTCGCAMGYSNDTGTCQDIDDCGIPTSCNNMTEQCVNTNDSYTCMCAMGYSNDTGTCQDMDECKNPSACSSMTEKCLNGVGFYTCVCIDGYSNETGTCRATYTAVGVNITLTLEATQPLDNTTSPYYIQLSNKIKEELLRVYRQSLGNAAVLDVVIIKLRVGSIIVTSEVLVANNQTANPESLVSKGTRDLLVGGLTIGGDKVTVPSVAMSGATYNASSSVCDIYRALGNCNNSHPCIVDAAGLPECQSPAEENLDLIIGLAVGIPLFFVAALVITFIIYCIVSRRRHRESFSDDADSDQTASIFAHKLPTMGNWGAPHPLYDNRSLSNGSDGNGSDGNVVGVGGRGTGRGRSDFKDSAWYDRSQPFATSVSQRTAAQSEVTANPNNSSWDYIFNALGPYRQSQPYAIRRPQVETTPNPLQVAKLKRGGPGSITSA